MNCNKYILLHNNRCMYVLNVIIITSLLLLPAMPGSSQEPPGRRMSVDELISLAEKNSIVIHLSQTEAKMAGEAADLAKSNRIPSITTGFSYGYISNADTWTPSFSKHEERPIPHNATQFNLDASWLMYAGGRIGNQYTAAENRVAAANMATEDSKNEIVAKALSNYLEILRLQNEQLIYQQNLALAENRLRQVTHLKEQGLITSNDVLQTALSISALTLQIRRAHNMSNALNYELSVMLGLEDTPIIPDSTVWQQANLALKEDELMSIAFREHPRLKAAGYRTLVASAELGVARAEKRPEISLYAFNNLQRPFMVSLPPTDIYFNVWQAGIRVRYNITGSFRARHSIAAGKSALLRQQQATQLLRQNMSIAVRYAFIRYQESIDEQTILNKDLQLAAENYRIVERRYMQQLALITEMTDAANARIAAAIRLANGKVRILQQYYSLLREAGMPGAQIQKNI
jgi:outer membrane protein